MNKISKVGEAFGSALALEQTTEQQPYGTGLQMQGIFQSTSNQRTQPSSWSHVAINFSEPQPNKGRLQIPNKES